MGSSSSSPLALAEPLLDGLEPEPGPGENRDDGEDLNSSLLSAAEAAETGEAADLAGESKRRGSFEFSVGDSCPPPPLPLRDGYSANPNLIGSVDNNNDENDVDGDVASGSLPSTWFTFKEQALLILPPLGNDHLFSFL